MSQAQKKHTTVQRENWNLTAQALVGRRTIAARYLTDAECNQQGWHRSTIMLVLDNGMTIVPMSDDEGNDAGSLMVLDHLGENVGMPAICI